MRPLASSAVILASIALLVGIWHSKGMSNEIFTRSADQIYNRANDPKLPMTLNSNLQCVYSSSMAVTNTTSNSKDLAFAYIDSAMKTERFGEAKRFTLVFAGTCASCSLKAINPLKLSETLGPSHLLILVYSSPLRAIRQEFKKGNIGKSTIIVADPDNVLTSSLNAFFPYRHVSGDVEGISLIVTKLQDRNEPESECYK